MVIFCRSFRTYVPRLPDGLKFLDIIRLIWWPNNYCCQSTQGLVIIIILYILNGFSKMEHGAFMKKLLIILILLTGCATQSQLTVFDARNNPEPYKRVKAIIDRYPLREISAQKYSILVADSNVPNAFVSPAKKQLIIFNGLIERMNDEELAAIMLHEDAHIKLGHVGKHVAASQAISTAFQVANVFLPGVGYANLLVNPVVSKAYSRSQEEDADKDSVKIGKSYGIEPEAYISALEKLKTYAISQNISDTDRTGIFDSHPNLQYRIERIREEGKASSVAAVNKKDEIAIYTSIIKNNPEDADAYYKRGKAYEKVNYQNALKDYAAAARLGHKEAQEYLTTKSIQWQKR